MTNHRISRLIKPFVRWRPRRDGRHGTYGPMLEPNWVYEIWARVFKWEIRRTR
jgi:hypothetical protein